MGKETDRFAHGLSATRPADPVDIILGMLGYVVVNDMGDACDVEPASSNIGRHKNGVFSRAKAGQGFRTLCL